jgi:hypothetical protein
MAVGNRLQSSVCSENRVEPPGPVCSVLYSFAARIARIVNSQRTVLEKTNIMKRYTQALLLAIVLIGSSLAALAANVQTDYDHSINFSQYNTYSWGKLQASNPFFAPRIQAAVDNQLQSRGWKLVPSGGAVTVFASDNIHSQQEVQTMYDNYGGGWGFGWGWRSWAWSGGWPYPGYGNSTTTTVDQPVSNLVIDMFEGSSKKLLWRGLATEDLSSNADKNTKKVDNDINDMFRGFPPKPGK